MLLFTIMARDNWGHGEKSIIIFSARSAHISNRCSGCLDANDTWNDKYNQILSELGKGSESHGSAHHIYDRLRSGPDHGNRCCLSRDQDTAVSLACATRDKVPFCNWEISGTVEQGQGVGEHQRSGRVFQSPWLHLHQSLCPLKCCSIYDKMNESSSYVVQGGSKKTIYLSWRGYKHVARRVCCRYLIWR